MFPAFRVIAIKEESIFLLNPSIVTVILKTYLQATDICKDQGSDSRLCSTEELVCATGTGCDFDTELVESLTTAQVIDSDPAQKFKTIYGNHAPFAPQTTTDKMK